MLKVKTQLYADVFVFGEIEKDLIVKKMWKIINLFNEYFFSRYNNFVFEPMRCSGF